jgi:DNA-binding NarL/FixJ family response regulator
VAGVTIRIGLVDDHPVVLDGLAAALGAVPGLEVAARAGTIAGAAALLARADLDVVLLDVRLGDDNALSLLRGRPVPGPAVLVLSSFTSGQYVAAAIRLGAQGFALKTAPLEEVAEAVRLVAAGGSWFTAAQLRAGAEGPVRLTGRERDVVGLLVDGLSNDEIASRLAVSVKTVEAHLSRLYGRLGAMSRLELGLRAEREGWLDLDPG